MTFEPIELSAEDLSNSFFENALFISVAAGGAMGEPGGVEIIDGSARFYHFNTLFGDVDYKTFLSAFPTIQECKFDVIGEGSIVPTGWNYVHLGMGNHLIVRDIIFRKFSSYISDCSTPGEIYQNWKLAAMKSLAGKTKSSIQIIKKGITDFSADCIVNAANEGLWQGGGVCGAIFRAAGSAELTKACNAIGHCDTGSAVITPAFKLDAKYIIHAVGPVYRDGKHGEPSQLYDCYKASLELAKKHNCHSIVFPVISAGIFGYPQKEAWKKAIQACVTFIIKNLSYDITIMFAVLDSNMITMGQTVLSKITAEYGLSGSEQEATLPAAKKEPEQKQSSEKPSSRADRIQVFKDTMDWINSDPKLSKSISQAKRRTDVFYEDDYPAFSASPVKAQAITVTQNRSYEAAMNLHRANPDKKIAVMNFANAFHAGGGVISGAGAQEESLCRCSTLYPLLYRRSLRDSFYKHHKDLNTAKASDSLVYTEGVIICKSDTNHPERLPETEWVAVDVITIAAPDLRNKANIHVGLVSAGTSMNDAELFGYHVKRAIHMLTVAAHKKADILVLGAFGCGAFQNNPEVVAKAYKIALDVFPKVFEKIEFAVYCPPDDSRNYDTFKRIFETVSPQSEEP